MIDIRTAFTLHSTSFADHNQMGQVISKCCKLTNSSHSVHVAVNDRVRETVQISSETAVARSINKNYSSRPIQARIIQNFTLLWLDSNIDEYNVTQLRHIINSINILTNPDQCVEFLNRIKHEKVFMIVSGTLCQSVIPLVHDMSQLDSIYIFCENPSNSETPATLWTKVKGVFTQIETICSVLKRDIQQCDRDSVSISVTSKDLNRLEPSFMYTQLLKEILLNMEYDDHTTKEFIEFCRQQFRDNTNELKIIKEFEDDYHVHTPIWWYTRECFTYQMLNRALRVQDIEIIIKMGFFLRDVHWHLEKLHSKINRHNLITVYRGKTMSNADFEEIKEKQDGLLAFNTFLSTSLNEQVSLEFARKSLHRPDSVAVLFQITIDPSILSTPFAPIKLVSAIPNEDEVLFTMNTVFRIGQIKQIEDRLWRVELTSTKDDDQKLKRLTEYMRKEISGSNRWQQLGYLLFKMGHFDKAEEIIKILIEETFKDDEKMHPPLYNYLGEIKCSKGNYREALELYQKSFEIQQKYLESNHPDLMSTYNNIGLIHDNMGEYTKALASYEKSVEIGEKSLLPNRIVLSEAYNNTGTVYLHMGDYRKALEYFQKSLEISLETLPENHPDLATIYDNTAQAHHQLKEYSKALEFYQKSLDMRQKSLPPNHPDLGVAYNNIGLLYCNMGDFPKALEFYHKDLHIKEKSLPPNHPNLAITYNNIGLVYNNMKEFSKALEFYEKSLEIQLKSLPPNHPELATNYNNVGLLYYHTGEYSKALQFYERAVEIARQTLPENHPHLQWYQQVLAAIRLKCNSL